jgi:hypothetical protein
MTNRASARPVRLSRLFTPFGVADVLRLRANRKPKPKARLSQRGGLSPFGPAAYKFRDTAAQLRGQTDHSLRHPDNHALSVAAGLSVQPPPRLALPPPCRPGKDSSRLPEPPKLRFRL